MVYWPASTPSFEVASKVLFFASALVILYVYVGYPLLLSVLVGFRRRPKPAPGYLPFLSVLIAAHNEEAVIGEKIKSTLALDYPRDKLEILVLSDGSTDRTDSIVKGFADPHVRLLRVEGRRGKTYAQNQGVREARGEILVFSDATTIYHPQALRYLACNYGDPTVGAVSGRYQYFDPRDSSPTGPGSITFWNYENLIKRLQSRIKTITGCCGCIYSVRSNLYTDVPADVISDLVEALSVVQKGYRVVFEDRALAYEETTTSVTEEFAMRVRVVTRGMRGILTVTELLNPWKHAWVSFQLLSHKVLRWLIPLFLAMLFASNALLLSRPAFRHFLPFQLLFYGIALLSLVLPVHRWWKPLGFPLHFCILNAAALCSLIEVMRGAKYVVWQPVRTQHR